VALTPAEKQTLQDANVREWARDLLLQEARRRLEADQGKKQSEPG